MLRLLRPAFITISIDYNEKQRAWETDLNGMVHDLLARRFAVNVATLVHILQQLRSGSFGDAVLEVGADVCRAVGAVLLAQVV